jgi:hypothetical protein
MGLMRCLTLFPAAAAALFIATAVNEEAPLYTAPRSAATAVFQSLPN